MKTKYVVTEINLHVSRHISKLGHNIYAFSTVPGNEAHQPKLNDELLSNVHVLSIAKAVLKMEHVMHGKHSNSITIML